MPRWAKQLFIGCVYVVIFALIGFGVYRLSNPAPTCTDGVKNQSEDGVDCGAQACGKLCVPEPLDLKVRSVKVFNTRPQEYDILAEIENPNDIYGATGIPYTLSLVNSSNGAIATRRGTFFIVPKQTRYLVVTALKTKEGVAQSVVVLGKVLWRQVDPSAPRIDFPLRREQYAVQAGGGSTLEGAVYNNSDFDFGTVDINVLLYNAQNEIIGINHTETTTVPSRTERYFKVSWPFTISDTVVRTFVQATTDVFSNENFLKQYGEFEQFQQF
ncbi:MAG: FxLYD domain-containing protein [Patescibacteria group bacterium]